MRLLIAVVLLMFQFSQAENLATLCLPSTNPAVWIKENIHRTHPSFPNDLAYFVARHAKAVDGNSITLGGIGNSEGSGTLTLSRTGYGGSLAISIDPNIVPREFLEDAASSGATVSSRRNGNGTKVVAIYSDDLVAMNTLLRGLSFRPGQAGPRSRFDQELYREIMDRYPYFPQKLANALAKTQARFEGRNLEISEIGNISDTGGILVLPPGGRNISLALTLDTRTAAPFIEAIKRGHEDIQVTVHRPAGEPKDVVSFYSTDMIAMERVFAGAGFWDPPSKQSSL